MSSVDSNTNKSIECDTSDKSFITDKEKGENKVLHKFCCIYFLYHFDLGSKYLEDGIDKKEFCAISDVIENTIKIDLIEEITYNDDLTIKIPTYLREVNPENYPIGIRNLHIELKLSDQDKSSTSQDGYTMNLAKAHIILFDTGVATVSLKFELNFGKEINPMRVYYAYKKIYCKVKECLNENGIEHKKNSEELTIFKKIDDIIKDIREKLLIGQANLYVFGDESSLSPMPLFWIPKMEWNKSKQFFSLLYLKPQLNNDNLDWRIQTNDQLKEVKSTYCDPNENHFACTWNAALLIDNDMENIETYLGLLELSSYIWLAAYLLVDALEDIIEKDIIFKVGIEEERIEKNNEERIEKNNEEVLIKKINKLRGRSYYIQQIKHTSLLSLWGNSVEIFDKILEDAWQTEKTLYAKIEEQAEFLNSMFQSMYEDKQNKLNSKISNGLSLLQAMSIPLVLFLTLLTLSNDSSICSINSSTTIPAPSNDTVNKDNAANWCTNNDTLLRIMILLLVVSILGSFIWYKKSLEIKVNPIK